MWVSVAVWLSCVDWSKFQRGYHFMGRERLEVQSSGKKHSFDFCLWLSTTLKDLFSFFPLGWSANIHPVSLWNIWLIYFSDFWLFRQGVNIGQHLVNMKNTSSPTYYVYCFRQVQRLREKTKSKWKTFYKAATVKHWFSKYLI